MCDSGFTYIVARGFFKPIVYGEKPITFKHMKTNENRSIVDPAFHGLGNHLDRKTTLFSKYFGAMAISFIPYWILD